MARPQRSPRGPNEVRPDSVFAPHHVAAAQGQGKEGSRPSHPLTDTVLAAGGIGAFFYMSTKNPDVYRVIEDDVALIAGLRMALVVTPTKAIELVKLFAQFIASTTK
jgi:hypothetical protein